MKKIIFTAFLLTSTSAFAMGIGNPADFPSDFPKDWPKKEKAQNQETKKTLKAKKAKTQKRTIAAN